MRGQKQSPVKRIRKLDKSHVEIILRVRQFFEHEKEKEEVPNINQVIERTSKATGINRNTLRKIKNIDDVNN